MGASTPPWRGDADRHDAGGRAAEDDASMAPSPAASLDSSRNCRPLAFLPLTVHTTRPDAGKLSITVRRDGTPHGGGCPFARRHARQRNRRRRLPGRLWADAASLVALVLPLPAGATVNAQLRIDASDELDR